MRVLWILPLLLAGCVVLPDDEVAATPPPAIAGELEFSFQHTSEHACGQYYPDGECRIYSLWFTNVGDASIPTDRLGWLARYTSGDGTSDAGCTYAESAPHDFDVVPGRRVNLVIGCVAGVDETASSIFVYDRIYGGADLAFAEAVVA